MLLTPPTENHFPAEYLKRIGVDPEAILKDSSETLIFQNLWMKSKDNKKGNPFTKCLDTLIKKASEGKKQSPSAVKGDPKQKKKKKHSTTCYSAFTLASLLMIAVFFIKE
ncbi:hypothetical protein GCK32_016708 [Trichostrongylus colubriformis]|uniref:Uncharacterized protein n=1 Tax=Trichostrongylus colubriformis TaxID=6319 RepID=A0AAN8F5W4_TRICO